jgi:tRNA(fMet)-specific endonuclease VapC
LAQVRKAISGDTRSLAYLYLHKAINDLARLNVLDYDRASDRIYQELRQQSLRIGTQDLRIAAIVLANNSTLVTRNYSDFSKVPGLILDDWTT